MGYIRHHAIVVTGPDEWFDGCPTIHEAREAAVDVGCLEVTDVVGPGLNGTSSFLVAPDGSKEGWTASDEGDRARDNFILWLRAVETPFSWAELVLSDDDHVALIERNSWDGS